MGGGQRQMPALVVVAMAIGNKWTFVDVQTQGLDQEQRVMEYEAYAFESRPTTVLSILNKVCD